MSRHKKRNRTSLQRQKSPEHKKLKFVFDQPLYIKQLQKWASELRSGKYKLQPLPNHIIQLKRWSYELRSGKYKYQTNKVSEEIKLNNQIPEVSNPEETKVNDPVDLLIQNIEQVQNNIKQKEKNSWCVIS